MSATMKIRALDSMVGEGFVYAKGGIYDAPEARAKELVRAGLAEYAGPAAAKQIETPEQKTEKPYITRGKK